MRIEDSGAPAPLDRISTVFIAVMGTLSCVLLLVMIWAVIRLVLHFT